MSTSTSTDLRAMRGLALAVWRSLTDAQRSALRRARPGPHADGVPRLEWNTHARVVAGLVAREMVTVEPSMFTDTKRYPLTLEARLALEVGRAHDAEQVKARLRRRRKQGIAP